MEGEGFLVGPEFVRQVESVVRRLQAQVWNPTQLRGRWQQVQPSAGSNCTQTYELRLMWNPTDAEITIQVKYNDVTEDVVITRGMTALEIQDEFNAHSEFGGSGCSVGGTGGYLWNSNMILYMPPGATIEGFSAVMTTREYSPTAEFYLNTCACV